MIRFIKGILAAIGALILVGGIVTAVGVHSITATSGPAADTRRDFAHDMSKAVASDLIEQYDFLVKNGGSAMEICMQSGAVAYAYMNANDSAHYKAWKSASKRDCARAGL